LFFPEEVFSLDWIDPQIVLFPEQFLDQKLRFKFLDPIKALQCKIPSLLRSDRHQQKKKEKTRADRRQVIFLVSSPGKETCRTDRYSFVCCQVARSDRRRKGQ
jgi:hypothetical protein